MTVPRRCFYCGLFYLSMFVRFLSAFDILFILFRIVWWERAVLLAFHSCCCFILCSLNCMCPFPIWCLGKDVKFNFIGSWSDILPSRHTTFRQTGPSFTEMVQRSCVCSVLQRLKIGSISLPQCAKLCHARQLYLIELEKKLLVSNAASNMSSALSDPCLVL